MKSFEWGEIMQNHQYDQHIVTLNQLSDTLKKVSRSKDLKESFNHIFEFSKQLLNYTMMVIYMYDEKKEELTVVAAQGTSTEKLKSRTKFKIGEGVVGWVAKEKKAIVLKDATKAKDFRVRRYYKEDPLIKSFMAVPLIYENKVLGILSVSHNKPHVYKEKDVQMMSIIASQVAAIIKINKLLQDRTKIYKLILHSINTGVIVVDNRKKITLFNNAAEKITGFSTKQVIGKKLNCLKDSPYFEYILKTFKTKQPIHEVETTLYDASKNEKSIVISTTVLRDSENNFLGVTAIFRDISEYKKLQEEISRTERLASLGRLTAGVAHEIRNPLLPIRTAASYLLKKTNPDHEYYRLIKIICEESDRLNKFLNDFVSLAKPSDSKETFELNQLILEIADFIKLQLESKDIKLKLDLCSEKTTLFAAVQEFRQVLINLLLNAIDAMSDGGTLTVKTFIENGYLVLKVKDTGCGIERKNLKNVFDPFYTTKSNGTGLGLFIVHNIVTKNNGKIYLQSTEGKGTTVTVKLKRYFEE